MRLIRKMITGTLALALVGTLAIGFAGCKTANGGSDVEHEHGTGSKEHKVVTQ